jgi:salicylate hydroxylase
MPKPTPPPKQPFHIAIIGGGIGGLSLTIGLLKYPHISVTIYESASCFDEIGAGVGFGPNAVQAMQLLHPGIHEGFQAISTTNGWESKFDEWYPFYLAMDVGKLKAGTLLATVKSGNGKSPSWTVHRKDFLKVLASLVPDGTAVFGKRAVGVDQSGDLEGKVVISFQDGTKAEADAVIGCDGVRSVCRGFVFGEDSPFTEQVFSGKYCYRALVPMEKAREVLGGEVAMNKTMYLGRHGHILGFPVQSGKTMNVVAFRTKADGKWEHPNWLLPITKEDMLSDFEGFSDEAMKIMRVRLDSFKLSIEF